MPSQDASSPNARLSTDARCSFDMADLSALLDGELEAHLVPEAVDRILHCECCARYYAEARRLQGLLTVAGRVEGLEPPAELWNRITEEAGKEPERSKVVRPSAWFSPRVVGLLAAAAVLVFCTWFLVNTELFTGSNDLSTEIQALSGSGAPMTDDRFVAIASELLQADERYLDEMRSLMRQLESERYAERSTSESRRAGEGSFPLGDEFDPLESERSGTDVSVQLW
ncbi:MAG: hypothetical protein AAGK22_19040 [Acidobacteriota bacterium]